MSPRRKRGIGLRSLEPILQAGIQLKMRSNVSMKAVKKRRGPEPLLVRQDDSSSLYGALLSLLLPSLPGVIAQRQDARLARPGSHQTIANNGGVALHW